jgi:membrane associated rhomboid family serine protease
MTDLPFRRRPARPSWVEPIAARLTPSIKALVIANTLVYFFYVMVREAQGPMIEHLALGPAVLHEPWQLFTALFVHLDFIGFVLNMVGLWFVGAYIERTQGTRRFVTLFLAAGILGNLAIALVAPHFQARGPYAGTSFAILALFVAFGRIYGAAPTQVLGGLYLKAHHLAMIFVAWALIADLFRGDIAAVTATLVITATGYILAAPGGLRELYDSFRARRQRQRYRVIDGGAPRKAKGRSNKYWN